MIPLGRFVLVLMSEGQGETWSVLPQKCIFDALV